MKIRKAVIPAAGMGTRFLPATKAIPKEMLPIIDKPTIQFIIEEAVASGIDEIIIVTSKGKTAIADHFDRAFELEHRLQRQGKLELLSKAKAPAALANIHYARQTEPLGLGHAIWCARSFIQDEPFVVLLGDTFFDANPPVTRQLIDKYETCRSSMLAVQPVASDSVSSFGIMEGVLLKDGVYSVDRLVEKPNVGEVASNMALIGRYLLTPAIFDVLARQQPGVGGEIQLTDALVQLQKKEPIYACEVAGNWHDVGDPAGFLKTILSVAQQREDLKRILDDFKAGT